jgi:hypothetical protein
MWIEENVKLFIRLVYRSGWTLNDKYLKKNSRKRLTCSG